MSWLGYRAEDSTIEIYFTTHDGSGGAVAPSDAFEAADVRIYKDGSATQKATTNGITMTSPFDSVTGLHLVSIDTSNDTGDAGFWADGSRYAVVLSPDTETVDSQTVIRVVGEFILGRSSVNTTQIGGQAVGLSSDSRLQVDVAEWNDVPLATTDKLDVLYTDWLDGGRLDLILDARASQTSVDTIDGIVDAILVDTDTTIPTLIATAQADLDIITGTDGVTLATAQANYAPAIAGDQMDLVNAPNATAITAIQAGLSTYDGSDTPGTTTLLSRVVGTIAAGTHVAQSGDSFARLGAPAGASVSADIAAITGTAFTEAYAALGAEGTLPELLYEIRSHMAEKVIVDTTLTTKKLDGSTTAATYTLDDANNPTSITRAS